MVLSKDKEYFVAGMQEYMVVESQIRKDVTICWLTLQHFVNFRMSRIRISDLNRLLRDFAGAAELNTYTS